MATITPMRRKYRPVTIRFHADNADDEHPPPELLDPEIIEAVEKRDEYRCLLCGSEELLVTHRVVSEHGKGVEVRLPRLAVHLYFLTRSASQPVYWLVGLGIVPQSYRSDAPSNIMICSYTVADFRSRLDHTESQPSMRTARLGL